MISGENQAHKCEVSRQCTWKDSFDDMIWVGLVYLVINPIHTKKHNIFYRYRKKEVDGRIEGSKMVSYALMMK